MSYRLYLYQVNLANFHKLLGSKDIRVVDKAFKWLEENSFIHLEQPDTKAIPDMCRVYLKRLVFEGRIGEKLSPKDFWSQEWLKQLEERNRSKYSSTGYWSHYKNRWYEELEDYSQSTLFGCVEALFLLDPLTYEHSEVRHWHYREAYQVLKKTNNLTANEEILWKYLLSGRPFFDEPFKPAEQDYDNYCGYLTHEELLVVIESLKKFLVKLKTQPEEIPTSELLETELNEVEYCYEAFAEIAEGGNDLFCVDG